MCASYGNILTTSSSNPRSIRPNSAPSRKASPISSLAPTPKASETQQPYWLTSPPEKSAPLDTSSRRRGRAHRSHKHLRKRHALRARVPAGNLPPDRSDPVPGSGAFFVYAPMDALMVFSHRFGRNSLQESFPPFFLLKADKMDLCLGIRRKWAFY